MRAAGSDDAVRLIPPQTFSLEGALEHINEDETVEVTPKSIRMRKKILPVWNAPVKEPATQKLNPYIHISKGYRFGGPFLFYAYEVWTVMHKK